MDADGEHLCTTDLGNGGRGIRNQIEAHLINPLARALFDQTGDSPVRIERVEVGSVTTLVLENAS